MEHRKLEDVGFESEQRVASAEASANRIVNTTRADAEAQGRTEEELTQAADLRRQRDVLGGELQQQTKIFGQLATRLNSMGVTVEEHRRR